MSTTVPPWNPRVEPDSSEDTRISNDLGRQEARNINFIISTTKSMFLYRLGIGELQFNPKNIQIKENISINQIVENNLYARTNPFVSYTSTNRLFTVSFIMAANSSGFNLVADASAPINSKSINNGDNGVVPFMNVVKSFLYANYQTVRDSNNAVVARTIKSPPVFKLANKSIISNGTLTISQEQISADKQIAKEHGLLGFITDFKMDPLFGIGYMPYSQGVTDVSEQQQWEGSSFKEVAISFTFLPIFEEPLGWASEELNGRGFTGVKELGGVGGANIISNILKK